MLEKSSRIEWFSTRRNDVRNFVDWFYPAVQDFFPLMLQVSRKTSTKLMLSSQGSFAAPAKNISVVLAQNQSHL